MSASASEFLVRCPAGGQEVDVSARLYAAPAPAPCGAWLILAHGAGAGHDSTFMVSYAGALSARGITTVTFNFPYTQRGRRLPDAAATLEACWRATIAAVRERAGAAARIVAGGKSMGGRIASQVAADDVTAANLAGLVFLGYPLHPPGGAERRRTAHWAQVRLPALFVQGSRDTFGSPDELRANLPTFGGTATVIVVEGGDHSFKVTRAAGRPQDSVHADIQDAIANWIGALAPRSTSSGLSPRR